MKAKISRESEIQHTREEMVSAIEKAFEDGEWKTLERIWGLLFSMYGAIMKGKGSNDFQIPHNDVRKNQKKDTLENFLICDREVYNDAQNEAERLRNL